MDANFDIPCQVCNLDDVTSTGLVLEYSNPESGCVIHDFPAREREQLRDADETRTRQLQLYYVDISLLDHRVQVEEGLCGEYIAEPPEN